MSKTQSWFAAVLVNLAAWACAAQPPPAPPPGPAPSESAPATSDPALASDTSGRTSAPTVVAESDAYAGGWTDPRRGLVASDGSRSLGNWKGAGNRSRDWGSKIVFFDPSVGDNHAADVYWWDGTRIIDSRGRAEDEQGRAYGDDPLHPNVAAIKPFAHAVGMKANSPGDPRLRTHPRGFAAVAGGYPDWFLFRRGQVHDTFDGVLVGGRSEKYPMVVASYGPLAEPRAVIAPTPKEVVYLGDRRGSSNPLSGHNGGESISRLHVMLSGLELHRPWSHLNAHVAKSPAGGPVTAFAEDCKWTGGEAGLVYLPTKTTVRRSVVAFRWNGQEHNQGYFTNGSASEVTFDEVVFYKNGYKTDPMTEPDPRRDTFSRNIYAGGGAQMGHTYRGIISADGASGGPQMRLGGTCENSLIIEGYWFSSTRSNKPTNRWMTTDGQRGQSALVRNNVQFIFQFPSPADPDSDGSELGAQPGWGYTLQGASFGSVVEGNIVSAQMLLDELGVEPRNNWGFKLEASSDRYQDGKVYALRDNVVRNNIGYRTRIGLYFGGDWSHTQGTRVENNVFVSERPISDAAGALRRPGLVELARNRFYAILPETRTPLPAGNTVAGVEQAAKREGWSDPKRTLKRYVQEQLRLSLLDWEDDPFLSSADKRAHKAAGEAYDPMGLKTFMAVATNMRRGGVVRPPQSGKPDWNADYAWDERFTGPAVVNWVREGFGLDPVESMR